MEFIDHPSHYNKPGRKECIVEIKEKYGDEICYIFCLTNAYKYLYRAGLKWNKFEDIEKAKWYWDYCHKNLHYVGNNRYIDDLEADIKTILRRDIQ